MRKLLLTTIIFFASLGFIFSQGFSNPPCIPLPVNSTEGYYYPYFDSLPCIEKGLPFSSAIQISMPSVFNSSILLDSLVIDSITGFPPGITYATVPASGVYYGDSSGCIAIAGTTTSDTGSYELTFYGRAVISTESSGTQIYSITQLAAIQDAPTPIYFLNLINPGDSCFPPPIVYGATGISDLIEPSQLNVFPNPTSGAFNFELNVSKAISGEVTVTNLMGQRVYSHQFSSSGLYRSNINLAGCAKGLYLLQLRTSAGLVSKRISIQ
jgi:hypothetical protein